MLYIYIYLTPKTSFVPASSKWPKKITHMEVTQNPQKGHDPKMPCTDLSICPMQPHRTQAQKLATEAMDQLAALFFFSPSPWTLGRKILVPQKGGILTYGSCM